MSGIRICWSRSPLFTPPQANNGGFISRRPVPLCRQRNRTLPVVAGSTLYVPHCAFHSYLMLTWTLEHEDSEPVSMDVHLHLRMSTHVPSSSSLHRPRWRRQHTVRPVTFTLTSIPDFFLSQSWSSCAGGPQCQHPGSVTVPGVSRCCSTGTLRCIPGFKVRGVWQCQRPACRRLHSPQDAILCQRSSYSFDHRV